MTVARKSLPFLLAGGLIFLYLQSAAKSKEHIASQKPKLTMREPGLTGPMAFSSDGKFFTVQHHLSETNKEMTVEIWNTETAKQVSTLQGATAYCDPITFGKSGKILATNRFHGPIKIWDSQTGRLKLTIAGEIEKYDVNDMTISPDEKLIAASTGELVWPIFTNDPWAPTQKDSPGKIFIWETESGELVSNINNPTRPFQDIEFSPDGTQIAARVCAQSGRGGRCVCDGGQRECFDGLKCDQTTIKTYRLLSGEFLDEVFIGKGGYYFNFSPALVVIAIAENEETVEYKDLMSGQTRTIPAGERDGLTYGNRPAWAAVRDEANNITIWSLDSSKPIAMLESPLPPGLDCESLYDMQFSPDERFLAALSHDSVLRIWDLRKLHRKKILNWFEKP